MGRKPLTNEVKAGMLLVRVTAAERVELDTAAAAAGKPTSTWVRDLALSAARATPAKRTRKPAK